MLWHRIDNNSISPITWPDGDPVADAYTYVTKPWVYCYQPHNGARCYGNRENITCHIDIAAYLTSYLTVNKLQYIDGSVQERRNSIALAMELRLSCTNPST